MIIDLIILFFVASQAVTKQGSYVFVYYLKFIPVILFGAMMYEIHNSTHDNIY